MTAIRATFEDAKRVKTRKCWQLIFEVPEESFDDAMEKLGGTPISGKDRWVGIAPIAAPEDATEPPQTQTAPETVERPKSGTICKRAVLLCKRPEFQAYMNHRHDEPGTASLLRYRCGAIKSRSELDHNPEAGRVFEKIEHAFRTSQRGETDPDMATQYASGPT